MILVREIDDGYRISAHKDTAKYLDEFKNQDREHVVVLGLDTKSKVLYRDIVSIGTLNASLIHPREVFKKAIMQSADSIIIAHNHPSGDTEPSKDDIEIHQELVKVGDILHIKVIDCLIIGKEISSFIWYLSGNI